MLKCPFCSPNFTIPMNSWSCSSVVILSSHEIPVSISIPHFRMNFWVKLLCLAVALLAVLVLADDIPQSVPQKRPVLLSRFDWGKIAFWQIVVAGMDEQPLSFRDMESEMPSIHQVSRNLTFHSSGRQIAEWLLCKTLSGSNVMCWPYQANSGF